MRIIKSKIAGVFFEDRQNLIKQYARDGKYLYIRPKSDDKYEEKTYALYVKSGFWIFKSFISSVI